MVKKPHKQLKKSWKIMIPIIVVVVIICGGFIAWLNWTGSPKEILSVANQFKPDSSWKLTENVINPPRAVCISDTACPSIARSWTMNPNSSYIQVNQLLEKAGWKTVRFNSDCLTVNICSTYGKVKKYTIQMFLRYETGTNSKLPVLDLNIQES